MTNTDTLEHWKTVVDTSPCSMTVAAYAQWLKSKGDGYWHVVQCLSTSPAVVNAMRYGVDDVGGGNSVWSADLYATGKVSMDPNWHYGSIELTSYFELINKLVKNWQTLESQLKTVALWNTYMTAGCPDVLNLRTKTELKLVNKFYKDLTYKFGLRTNNIERIMSDITNDWASATKTKFILIEDKSCDFRRLSRKFWALHMYLSGTYPVTCPNFLKTSS